MKAIVFLSIFSTAAFSSEFTSQIWSQKNNHYLFSLHNPTKMLISKNCLNEEVSLKNSDCLAAKVFGNPQKIESTQLDFSGGKNPGAVVCRQYLKNEIRILLDSKNNENAFCVFKDGSMVSAINLQTLIKD
jgi:hypothetical protein